MLSMLIVYSGEEGVKRGGGDGGVGPYADLKHPLEELGSMKSYAQLSMPLSCIYLHKEGME